MKLRGDGQPRRARGGGHRHRRRRRTKCRACSSASIASKGAQGRTHEGSGIGLALVQELVKLHGGSIEARANSGAAPRFQVRIPFGTRALPAGQLRQGIATGATATNSQAYVQEALRWLPDAGPRTPTACAGSAEAAGRVEDLRFASTFGARIVLADDNADMRSYVRELLGRCTTSKPWPTAWRRSKRCAASRPDLVISDVMMPKLDGLGLLQALRADRRLRDVPVILLSARAGEEARIEGLNAGADDYMVKPFTARELLARVGALLELTRRTARAARSGGAASSKKPRARRTNSSPCWRTNCAIRWRRSAMPARSCRATCRPTSRCAPRCTPSNAR